MPRYFFNVDDGRSIPDAVGSELSDPAQVRHEAIRASAEMLRDGGLRGEEWRMTVTDTLGRTVFSLEVRVAEYARDS